MPIRLAANRVPRFYRGGQAIDELRGTAGRAVRDAAPEDWVDSATTAFGTAGDTVLVPFAAGPGEVRGRLEAVRCLPPAPEAAAGPGATP